jgi:CBS domain containing-hemolysin-like protein
MELVIQLTAIALTLLLAAVKSLQYATDGVSGFELNRKAQAGDAQAIAEVHRRNALPTLRGLQYFKEIIISVVIAALLIGTHGSVLGAFLSIIYFFLAYLVGVRGWLNHPVHKLQGRLEPTLLRWATKLMPLLRFMTSKPQHEDGNLLASREELDYLIHSDKHVLKAEEKNRLLAALRFGDLTVADAMVKRDDIATVKITETVGPVLLDRLHKAGHKVFVVVKKDVDDIKGWLYMSDATSGHPDLKTVKDATRSAVYYISETAPLEAVIGTALATGRQLFIVVNEKGETCGLISLADALTKLYGQPIQPYEVHTTPTIAK